MPSIEADQVQLFNLLQSMAIVGNSINSSHAEKSLGLSSISIVLTFDNPK